MFPPFFLGVDKNGEKKEHSHTTGLQMVQITATKLPVGHPKIVVDW